MHSMTAQHLLEAAIVVVACYTRDWVTLAAHVAEHHLISGLCLAKESAYA